MEIMLDREEARVLGCLLEKEMATPDYYPLSLNALVNACNQKSNRNPVVSFDEDTVIRAIDRLVAKDLVFESRLSRVPKYEEIFMKKCNLVSREASILCTLLLRGAQTAGEIRSRTDRLYAFDDLDQVLETLQELANAGYLEKASRQPGQKEDRFRHCLSEPDRLQPGSDGQASEDDFQESGQEAPEDPELQLAVERLEAEVQELRLALAQLRQEFSDFKRQFE